MFGRSAMNGPALEGLGQVLGSQFKAGSAGGSHLQHNGLRTAPEARLPFASHPGGGWRFLSHCWHLRPPPSARDKRLEAELTHNYRSKHSGLPRSALPRTPRVPSGCAALPMGATRTPASCGDTGAWGQGTAGTDVGWPRRWVRIRRVTHGMGWWQSHSGTLPADLGVRETACSFLWEREGDQSGNYYFIN